MKVPRWAYLFLGGLLLVTLFSGAIANDRPLLAYDGERLHVPVLSKQPYRPQEDEWAVWPPIPFAATTADLNDATYLPPLTMTPDGRHWLGTDYLGRDIAAGLVSGTRVAVYVGLGSVVVSLLLGLPLGAVAGFFGDHGLRVPRRSVLAWVVGTVCGTAYALACLSAVTNGLPEFLLLLMLSVGVGICLWDILLRLPARYSAWLRRPVGVPLDRGVVLLLELTVGIPTLVLLIALLAYLQEPSLPAIVLIIGLVGWTPVARFLRAELIRVRDLPYIAAARVGGVGEWRLLFRHALPNAIGPVVVVAAFMVGTSILAEATLSFLGVGVPSDQVTWGSILQESRNQTSAWWLAVFPGLLLTTTVLACNSIRVRN
ncbi:ABC transporter permease [Lewinella sp. IMCC34183]|uniref:ABC transporter permease n=1 Tax=Lewinella sp. IMCC34183 TaxID=2248762 RepID=UPI000E2451F0|nr:ABC transporter permease [Lewinella sp. IMCC34183]